MKMSNWMPALLKVAGVGAVIVAAGCCKCSAAEAAPAPAKAPEVKAEAKPSEKAPEVKKVDVWASLPEVVATIDGKPVTKSELIASVLAQTPDGKVPEELTPEVVAAAAPTLVKDYINYKLLEAEQLKSGIKPNKADAKALMESQFKEMPQEQQELIKKQLAMQGKSLDQIVEEQASNEAFQKMAAMRLFLDRTVVKDASVSDEEVKKFYEENKKQFTTPADDPSIVRASHILVKVDEKASDADKKAALTKAEGLLKQAKADPSKFADLASKNSDCPSSANGGSLGAFGPGQMVPEFDKAARELKPGEISGLVKTQFGYHIIKRDPVQPEQVTPFDQVKAELKSYLLAQKQQKLMQDYLEKLQKDNKVVILVKAPAPAAAPKAPAAPAEKKADK